MTDDEIEVGVAIYVLPSEPNRPPQAILTFVPPGVQALVEWSSDSGTWVQTNDTLSTPVPEEISEAITTHAKDLGVEW